MGFSSLISYTDPNVIVHHRTPKSDTTKHSYQPDFVPAPRSPTDKREYLKLIHIPFSEDRDIDRIELPLVEVDRNKDGYNDYKELEKQLGSIPEIWKWEGTTEFHWYHRTLVKLPQNTYLKNLAHYSGVPVYGDAFVFSMKPWLNESERSKGARWVHMDNHFAGVAWARDREDHSAKILRLLLQCLPKPEIDEEK